MTLEDVEREVQLAKETGEHIREEFQRMEEERERRRRQEEERIKQLQQQEDERRREIQKNEHTVEGQDVSAQLAKAKQQTEKEKEKEKEKEERYFSFLLTVIVT